MVLVLMEAVWPDQSWRRRGSGVEVRRSRGTRGIVVDGTVWDTDETSVKPVRSRVRTSCLTSVTPSTFSFIASIIITRSGSGVACGTSAPCSLLLCTCRCHPRSLLRFIIIVPSYLTSTTPLFPYSPLCSPMLSHVDRACSDVSRAPLGLTRPVELEWTGPEKRERQRKEDEERHFAAAARGGREATERQQRGQCEEEKESDLSWMEPNRSQEKEHSEADIQSSHSFPTLPTRHLSSLSPPAR